MEGTVTRKARESYSAELRRMRDDLRQRRDRLRNWALANALEEIIGPDQAEKVFRMLQARRTP